MRRVFVAVALLIPLACGPPVAEEMPRRLNVLLISIDTLRADHLGTYGYSRPTSPRIDALAASGVRFDWVFSQSPKTAPSHMTLLTGLYPQSHGISNLGPSENRRLADDVETLAELFRSNGYRTAAYTGGGHISEEVGFARGFERFAGPLGIGKSTKAVREVLSEWADEPFFVFLHTYAVHDPYTPSGEYRDLFVDPAYSGQIVSSAARLRELAGPSWADRHRLYWSKVKRESPADRQHLIDLYDASIRHADERVGNVLDSLRANGLHDRTLVVLLSDHGEMFWEHRDYLHNALYEEILRVPLVMQIPDAFAPGGRTLAGQSVRVRVRLIDVMPTLLQLAHVPVPFRVQGESLVPLLEGREGESRDVASLWPRANLQALRRGPWKLIRAGKESEASRVELYDLEGDPGETRNIAQEREAVRDVLLERMKRFDREWNALRGDSPRPAAALDRETRDALEALGYLGGANDPASPERPLP